LCARTSRANAGRPSENAVHSLLCLHFRILADGCLFVSPNATDGGTESSPRPS